MFSNYDDLVNIILKYNGELKIQEMKKDMKLLKTKAASTTMLFFLKGELSGYEHLDYKAVRAVRMLGFPFLICG